MGTFLGRTPRPLSREQPREKVHRRDGHADAKEHAGKHSLGTAFAKGERKARHNNCDQRQTPRNGAGEGRLQYVDGVLPRGIRLGKDWSGEKETDACGQGNASDVLEKESTVVFHGTSQMDFKVRDPEGSSH